MTFTFGIYPGGLLGSDTGIIHPVTPDDPALIASALQQLQGDASTLLVRAYRPFTGSTAPDTVTTPAEPELLLGGGRKLDLVLQFREPTGALDGWLDFIRATVRTEGPRLAMLQICEEPNLDFPVVDGSIPNIRQALIQGVIAAKEEVLAQGYDIVVGFNAVPTFNPADTFWSDLGAEADDRFHRSLDYVGLDFFPDVFRRLPPEQLTSAARSVIAEFRSTQLARAGIAASVPIHICEHGWPTGPDRPEERQAEVIEQVIRLVAGLREELHLTGYSFFSLRDADSAGTGLFDRFGLLRDDYSPKPAFDTYRRLIQEFGR
jgi:hypothetical protein